MNGPNWKKPPVKKSKKAKDEAWLRLLADRTGIPYEEIKDGAAKSNKYGAKKTIIGGHVFQSGIEARYYEANRHNPTLVPHPPRIHLTSGIYYKPDFYMIENGRPVWVDTKGGATKGGRFPTVCKLWKDFGQGVLRIVEMNYKTGRLATTKEIYPKGQEP